MAYGPGERMTVTKPPCKAALAIATAAHARLSIDALIREQDDPQRVLAAMTGLCFALLAALDEVAEGAAAEFLSNMGRSIEAMPDA